MHNQVIVLKDNRSDFHDLVQYPDGQLDINLYTNKLQVKHPIHIHCRIKTFSELEVLLCLVAALRKFDYHIQAIHFIYLFGMRSDRGFKAGPNYFRDVVAPIINEMMIPEVYIFAPHSELSLKTLHNADYGKRIIWEELDNFPMGFSAIGGDANAANVLASVQFPHWFYPLRFHFNKTRSVDGAIDVSLTLNDEPLPHGFQLSTDKPLLIFDDLCDAGGTFIAEAKKLREAKIANPLYLFVAHGLFTKGVDVLTEHFDGIICTNSYQDINHPKVKQIKVI